MTEAKPTIDLPQASLPAVNRMLSTPPFPDGPVPPEHLSPLVWVVDAPHPAMNDAKIVRMFIMPEGVEVYSVTKAAKGELGLRHTVPWRLVRMTEEIMPLDIFVDEIAEREKDDDGEDPKPNGAPAVAAS